MKTNLNFYTNVKLGLAMLAVAGLMMGTPVAAQAKGDKPTKTTPAPAISVQQLANLKFRVTLTQPVAERTYISIVNSANETLYRGQLTSADEQKGRVFDLSQLADDTYVFEVTAGSQKFTQSFELKTQTSRVVLARN